MCFTTSVAAAIMINRFGIAFSILFFVSLCSNVPVLTQPSIETTAQFKFNNEGVEKMNRGNNRGAIADFSEALKAEPTYTVAIANRALAKRRSHDYTGSLEDYNEAVRLSPTSLLNRAARASTREAACDYKGAITDYTELLRLVRCREPKESWMARYEAAYLHSRALLKEKTGDGAGAREDLTIEKSLRARSHSAHSSGT